MPREPSWWVWLITAVLLAAGLAGDAGFFVAAIVLSAGQGAVFVWKHGSARPYAVQIRLAYYAALLLVWFVPGLRWGYWLPMLGTFALVLFGYCLMARALSLLPWNRSEPVSPQLLLRTFFTAPARGRADHGLPPGHCPGGVCELEGRVAWAPTVPSTPSGCGSPR